MKVHTVYVVTDVRRPLRERARDLTLTVIAWLLLALAALGQMLGLLISALDALAAAWLGTRRLSYIAALLRQAVRDSRFSREDDQ
ncbi:hypothetical protein [Streptosporangium sp. NPDC004631]